MGLNSSSVEALQSKARNAGLVVFGVMQNRHAPAAQWLKSSHLQGQFGDILQVHVQCLGTGMTDITRQGHGGAP